MEDITTVELALLVIAGLASATYAKAEGASQLLAAAIGAGVAIIIFLLTT